MTTVLRAVRRAFRWGPDRVFSRSIAMRAALVWGVMRALSGSVSLGPVAMVFLYGMVTAAVLVDARARREDQFLAGLGTSRLGIAAVVAAAIAALELIVFLAVRVFAT